MRERVSKSGRNQVVAPAAADLSEWKRAIEPLNDGWRKAKPRNERTHAAFVEQLQRLRAKA